MSTPRGSGPYIVTQYDAGTQIVLEKNENYWKTAEDHDGLIPKQNVDQIICRFIAEDAQKTIALESGDVDYLFECPSIAISDYQNSDEINLYSINATNCEGLYFNCTEGSVCGYLLRCGYKRHCIFRSGRCRRHSGYPDCLPYCPGISARQGVLSL